MSDKFALFGDEQLPIAPSIAAVHKSNGERLLKLLRRAIAENTVSLSVLARETGIDNGQITRMLDGAAGVRPDFIAALLAKDHAGTIMRGLGDFLGYDVTPRTPDLAAENKRLREELLRLRDEVTRALEVSP